MRGMKTGRKCTWVRQLLRINLPTPYNFLEISFRGGITTKCANSSITKPGCFMSLTLALPCLALPCLALPCLAVGLLSCFALCSGLLWQLFTCCYLYSYVAYLMLLLLLFMLLRHYYSKKRQRASSFSFNHVNEASEAYINQEDEGYLDQYSQSNSTGQFHHSSKRQNNTRKVIDNSSSEDEASESANCSSRFVLLFFYSMLLLIKLCDIMT